MNSPLNTPIMKKIIFLLVLTTGLSCAGFAQQNNEPKGYWVIENNVKTPKQSIIYFYNNENQVVYKETVIGKKLRVNRPRVNRRLNAVLEQSLTAWQNNRQLKDDQQLVVKR
jgi:hypothetical protein